MWHPQAGPYLGPIGTSNDEGNRRVSSFGASRSRTAPGAPTAARRFGVLVGMEADGDVKVSMESQQATGGGRS
jgi:hypothetical protein